MADVRPAMAILKVTDLDTTLAWYQAVGFSVRGREDGPDSGWAEVACDDLVLQFLAGATPWDGTPGCTGCFYVHPVSVAAVHDAVRDRVAVEWGVEERPWGARELVLVDPDGYVVTFSEPLPG
jgi:catechol 2,3-dioxygenase-like lactoylglutathione lyase family enzyme